MSMVKTDKYVDLLRDILLHDMNNIYPHNDFILEQTAALHHPGPVLTSRGPSAYEMWGAPLYYEMHNSLLVFKLSAF